MEIHLDNDEKHKNKRIKVISKCLNSSRGMMVTTDEGINATFDELCMIYLFVISVHL
jgi:hypothetical protein